MYILAGDIGGTNSRLISVEVNHCSQTVLAEKNYVSNEYTDLTEVLNQFQDDIHNKVAYDAVCIAVAGPVQSGRASITNLPWVVRESDLAELFNTPNVNLINDFVAVSYGISQLKETDFLLLQQAGDESRESRDAAVIGAGTGLGASHLIWQGDHFQACSSETGHSGFAPENELQSELLLYLQKRYSHVSLEMLLSGRGLHNIYKFFHDIYDINESVEVARAIEKNDPAKVISEYAISESDELCQKTINCFVEIYGSAASNIALNYYPVSTVYIAGGIATKIKSKLLDKKFINAFVNKGLMSESMKKICIKLITEEKVGLYGAVLQAKSCLK